MVQRARKDFRLLRVMHVRSMFGKWQFAILQSFKFSQTYPRPLAKSLLHKHLFIKGSLDEKLPSYEVLQMRERIEA